MNSLYAALAFVGCGGLGLAVPVVARSVSAQTFLQLGEPVAPFYGDESPRGFAWASAVLCGTLGLFVVARFGITWTAAMAWALCASLVTASLIDRQHLLLPDLLTLPLLWVGLLVSVGRAFCSPEDAILGAALGYGSLWIASFTIEAFTGSQGIGGGDLKLLAALGAWLGCDAVMPVALVAVAIVALLVLVRRRDKPQLEFGPSLACAGTVMLFYHG